MPARPPESLPPALKAPALSVVVPVRNGASTLAISLGAIRASSFQDFELIVVDDGSSDDSASIARSWEARVVSIPPSGPAAARNAGVAIARGELVAFIDADCEVHHDTLRVLVDLMGTRADVDAVFGSYDDEPAAPGLLTQLKNLQHHFVHHAAAGESSSFWSGCSVIRRSVFIAAGGFDSERYGRPSIEDVELGARLHRAGHHVLLEPAAQVKHHKRWTFRSLLETDLLRRAVPWTRLMLADDGLRSDMNLDRSGRISGVAVAAACLFLALSLLRAHFLLGSAASLVVVTAVNLPFYRFLRSRRGLIFTLAAIPLHFGYFVVALTGLALGSLWAFVDRLRSDGPIASRLTARPLPALYAVALTLALTAVEVVRRYPWRDTLRKATTFDDWYVYYSQARDILHHGLAMHSVKGNYLRPAGFLYNYFIAGVFALFAENSMAVMIVQATLLGIAAGAMLLGFRQHFQPRGVLLLACFLTSICVLDCMPNYTSRLLSENLLLALVPPMLLLVVEAGRSSDWRLAALAGGVTALAFLTRPNTILAAPLFGALLLARASRNRAGVLVAFAFCWLGIAALLPLRNFVVSGSANVDAVTSTHDWQQPPGQVKPLDVARGYLRQWTRQTVFVFGFLRVMSPVFRDRPHWMVFWLGVFLLLVLRLWRRMWQWWEIVLTGFTFVYLGPLIAVSEIDNYGFRSMLPILMTLAVLSARGYELAWAGAGRDQSMNDTKPMQYDAPSRRAEDR